MDSDTKVTDTKAPTEKEDRLRRMYGKLPTRTDLLHHQLEVSSVVNPFRNLADHFIVHRGSTSIQATSRLQRRIKPPTLGTSKAERNTLSSRTFPALRLPYQVAAT
ncbi:uncharacterized protein VDAG_05172 [Verticillium dahliae VdLs.17]|uniref:Uncharacterized protein n=1 Tax=Verticillium dahliae (strain VdLs.17 / ATCC MYA-4575 / FGSC 10137) TaxID=498257 RepID=G2X4U0_VERDV|nr:uncharacterized protein VDAG_05172 [Verticillium dahliae VdLs.17]EGY23734.1 hypothetical protein VDAG_05172 [Verticillium dahliae VdLs.17]